MLLDTIYILYFIQIPRCNKKCNEKKKKKRIHQSSGNPSHLSSRLLVVGKYPSILSSQPHTSAKIALESSLLFSRVHYP